MLVRTKQMFPYMENKTLFPKQYNNIFIIMRNYSKYGSMRKI